MDGRLLDDVRDELDAVDRRVLNDEPVLTDLSDAAGGLAVLTMDGRLLNDVRDGLDAADTRFIDFVALAFPRTHH